MKWFATFLTSLIVMILALCYMANNKSPETIWVETTYSVAYGDTLWDICEENCGKTYVLEYMEMLKSVNGDLSTIYPGQEITILREEGISK